MVECEVCSVKITQKVEPQCKSCADRKAEIERQDGYEEGFDDGCDQSDAKFPRHELIELAAAIRRGDVIAAENALDVIASYHNGWPEAIANGRYSRKSA